MAVSKQGTMPAVESPPFAKRAHLEPPRKALPEPGMWPNGPGPADSPAYGQHYPSGPSQPYSQQPPGEVVTMVRSGEAQSYYRGDYTAIVVAPSGEVKIRVVSR